MLRKLSTSFGIVLLASSFAFAGQSTKPVAPGSTQPATTASAQQSPKNAPVKKHHLKKHHKRQKKQANQTNSSTQPKR